MDNDELEAIRQARMAELQKSQGGAPGGGQGMPQMGGRPGGAGGAQGGEDEGRVAILSQILTANARERLSRIRIVRQDRARQVEDMLIRLAQTGQIRKKVEEEELVSLLDQISKQDQKTTGNNKVIINRRELDDDDDDFFD